MTPIERERWLSPLTRMILDWFQAQPLLGTLILFMIVDIVMGVIAAFIKKELSSSVSWRGMLRKSGVILIIGVAVALERIGGDAVPLSKIVAFFYLATEGLSIMENAAAAGIPLPAVLIDALDKLKSESRTRAKKEKESVVHVIQHTAGQAPPSVQKVEVVSAPENPVFVEQSPPAP